MKGMLKKVLCMALATTMVVSLAACGKRGDASDAMAELADAEAAKQAVFKEVGTLDPEGEWFDSILVNGEDVIVVWSEYVDVVSGDENIYPGGEPVPYTEEPMVEDLVEEELPEEEIAEEDIAEDDVAEGEDIIINDPMMPMPEVEYIPQEYSFYYQLHFGKTTFGGTDMTVTTIDLPEKEYSNRIVLDPATGNYVILTEVSEEDYSDPENYVFRQVFYLNVYSQSGELLSREALDLGGNPDEWIGVYGMGIAANGEICLACDRKIVILDSQLKKCGEINFEDTQWLESFLVTAEGVPYAYMWNDAGDDSGNSFHMIDVANAKLGPAIKAPDGFWGNGRPGVDHDLYYNTDKGVYTYDFDTEENKLILNFVDSDIDYNYFNYVVPVDENRLVAPINDPETWETILAFYEKVPPEEVVDKTIITMGMVYADYEVRTQVIEFNKASDEYRIRMIEYYEYNNESDWDAGLKMFNNDILTSNAPDIIVLNPEMPINSYMDKGVLLNLNPYIEADEEISKENMASNILALGSKGNDTYILTANFMVSTMAMKESLVPNGESVSLNELRQLEAQFGNIHAFQDCTREDILRLAMEMNYSEFLDVETGKCAFNTPGFYELLEYAKTYPEEIDWDNMDDAYWMEYETAMRDNKALIQYFTISGFGGIGYTEQGRFGEEVAFVGFPGNEGTTGVIYPYIQMAISEDCEHPEEAWAFMRQFYTYEGQRDMGYGLPVNLTVMDEWMAQAQEKPYWTDENGDKIEYDETYWIGDQEIIIEPLSAERAQEIKEYALSVTDIYYFDSSIIDIIVEEASPFFAGQKTAEQAADIIQSRVQIYVNENQ